jgi:hypothetical protein
MAHAPDGWTGAGAAGLAGGQFLPGGKFLSGGNNGREGIAGREGAAGLPAPKRGARRRVGRNFWSGGNHWSAGNHLSGGQFLSDSKCWRHATVRLPACIRPLLGVRQHRRRTLKQMGASHGQLIVDDLIAALWSNDARQLAWCGNNFAVHGGGLIPTPEAEGILLRNHEIDGETVDRDYDFAPFVTTDRLQALSDGDLSTDEERRRVVLNKASRFFEDEGTRDAWQIARLTSSGGVVAFVALIVRGSSWEGVDADFVGVFQTEPQAWAALRELGFLDEDDLRARYLAS